jgi:hypothetical protein
MKISCLFSVDCNYDQPDHNLVCWWQKKPTLEQLAETLTGTKLANLDEETIVEVVAIFTGKEGKIKRYHYDTVFRIQDVTEGCTVNHG